MPKRKHICNDLVFLNAESTRPTLHFQFAYKFLIYVFHTMHENCFRTLIPNPARTENLIVRLHGNGIVFVDQVNFDHTLLVAKSLN